MTGDLISKPGDPLHATIDAVAELKADSGVWGCMGNHEQYARCRGEAQVYGRQKGVEFLRQDARMLRFGDARLNLVGVDYQRQGRPYLTGVEQAIQPGVVNLLLSHNPDVFPKAADLGFDLVLSGHTHGGQITLEIVEQTVNPGRFLTPFVSGVYQIGGSSIYVSRGVGTVTLPMRLGAEPEVAIIRLRRA
jgi:predicted MPP superfamily phosphohydrolase